MKLAGDGRLPYARIAGELGVATATVHQRVKRLREQGTIRGYGVDLDWRAVGLPVAAIVSIRTSADLGLGDVAAELRTVPYVVGCAAVTGEFDLYAQVRARTPEHLGEIIDEIRRIARGATQTVLVLVQYFVGVTPPLGEAQPDGTSSRSDR